MQIKELCFLRQQTTTISAGVVQSPATNLSFITKLVQQNTPCSDAFHANTASTPTGCTPSLDQGHLSSTTPASNWLRLLPNHPSVHRVIEESNHGCYQLRIPAKP